MQRESRGAAVTIDLDTRSHPKQPLMHAAEIERGNRLRAGPPASGIALQALYDFSPDIIGEIPLAQAIRHPQQSQGVKLRQARTRFGPKDGRVVLRATCGAEPTPGIRPFQHAARLADTPHERAEDDALQVIRESRR